jgi:hypothetical protein
LEWADVVTGVCRALPGRGIRSVALMAGAGPTCGTNLFWEIDDLPDSCIVAIGAFADPEFVYRQLPAPTFSVYKAHKHPWVEIPPSVTEDWD